MSTLSRMIFATLWVLILYMLTPNKVAAIATVILLVVAIGVVIIALGVGRGLIAAIEWVKGRLL